MRKITSLLILSTLILLLGAQSSFAGRHGAFLDLAAGSGKWEWDSDFDDDKYDIDSDSFAIGYVFDSDPTPSNIFNYRLNIGLIKHDLEFDEGETFESIGIYVENIFGFALIKNDKLRWWAGPLLRFGYYSGELDEKILDYKLAVCRTFRP